MKNASPANKTAVIAANRRVEERDALDRVVSGGNALA
jgi:hypothetical protein